MVLEDLISKYGSPLKLVYLPSIRKNISKVNRWFASAIKKLDYSGTYTYCYCTKSNHFKYVLDAALEMGSSLETSSAYDIDIIDKLISEGALAQNTKIICNGFKDPEYLQKVKALLRKKNIHTIPIVDNVEEIKALPDETYMESINIGIRIASEEEPKFTFYTSRLGIGYSDIIPFFRTKLAHHKQLKLKMLHFFINTGINDNSYYWSELRKCLKIYTTLKKECETLDCLNIGGGFPFKNSLSFEYDYEYLIEEILRQVKESCAEFDLPVPHIYTEFGSFTAAESGANIYTIVQQKQQNDREKWNLINSSFMTTLPDTWAINKKFIMLPINQWFEKYERVLLGGITCDSEDYYNSEQHINAIYLPKFHTEKPLHIGFFNTGAYQEALGGAGGLQHCLTPQPQKILIDKRNGKIIHKVFSKKQSSEELLKILGY